MEQTSDTGLRVRLEQTKRDLNVTQSPPNTHTHICWNEHSIRSQTAWPHVPALPLTSDQAKSLYFMHLKTGMQTPTRGRAVRARVERRGRGLVHWRALTRHKNH